ncbi:MAG: LicD family protein [Flexilinea sp.]|nr:LicD family protein [Flexilinea sp.]
MANDDSAIAVEGELLKKCQQIELSVVDDLASICEKYNINYTLGGGSALGAVRHQGMIPWDDDIDINIFRKDCEKFITALENEYPNKYWIHTPEKTKNYGLLFLQIRLKGTIMRGREDIDTNECGIGVDIFPYENTYDNKLLRIMHGCLCMAMKFCLSCRKIWEHRDFNMRLVRGDPEGEKSIKIKSLIGAITSIFSIDDWTHGTIRCCKMNKNNDSKFVAIPSGRKQFLGEIYRRDEIADTELVPFDGRKYRLTKAVDQYMKKLYGNYMQIPSIEKREHHIVYELDFGVYE